VVTNQRPSPEYWPQMSPRFGFTALSPAGCAISPRVRASPINWAAFTGVSNKQVAKSRICAGRPNRVYMYAVFW